MASSTNQENLASTEESNLVQHARRELSMARESPEIVEATLNIVREFVNVGHSGSSAHFHIELITRLLRYGNLTPLTDDPDEWYCHEEDMWGASGGIWQNLREGEAFSQDGGKTYTLLSERPRRTWWNRLLRRKAPVHTSQKHPVLEASQ